MRDKIRARVTAVIQPGTIVAIPTSPAIAPRLDTPEAELDQFRARVLRMTCVSSLTGVPQVTMPIGTVEGCPAGLSFLGWHGSDEILLDLVAGLARHCGMEG
jgi:amidase